MRVPTHNNGSQMLTQIQTLGALQSRLQTQVSTGQRIFQPEDDPAAVGRVLSLNAERSQLAQFATNASYALDVSQASFSGLTQIKKISDRAGELATLGVGNLGADAMKTYAAELDQLIEQGAQLANTRLRNDYLYGGTAVASPPFVLRSDGSGKYDYVGNATSATVQISATSSIAPGTSGATNVELCNFLNDLVDLRDALKTGVTANVTAVRPALTDDENNLVSSLSAHGAVQLRIEISQAQSQERMDNLEKLVSGETQVDMAETITRLNQASVAYQAALQSTTKIMGMSLLDFLN